MGQRGPFRPTGRPGGVDHEGDGGGIGLLVGRFLLLLSIQWKGREH